MQMGASIMITLCMSTAFDFVLCNRTLLLTSLDNPSLESTFSASATSIPLVSHWCSKLSIWSGILVHGFVLVLIRSLISQLKSYGITQSMQGTPTSEPHHRASRHTHRCTNCKQWHEVEWALLDGFYRLITSLISYLKSCDITQFMPVT